MHQNFFTCEYLRKATRQSKSTELKRPLHKYKGQYSRPIALIYPLLPPRNMYVRNG